MRRWTILLAACSAILVGLPMHAAFGQARVARDFRWAPPPGSESGGVLWRIAGESYVNGNNPESATLGRHLPGTWDILTVGTEGIESPLAHRWVIRLVSTDSVVRTRCLFGKCSGTLSYPAAGQVLGKGVRFDSVAVSKNPMRAETDVSVSYRRSDNRLTLLVGPLMMDAGDFYEVSDFADTTFAGRWESGGFAYATVKRGDLTVLEKPAGYFCARRIKD